MSLNSRSSKTLIAKIILFVPLLKLGTFVKSETTFSNPTLQQLFPSPLIFKENLTQIFEDDHVFGYVDQWVDPRVRWPFELTSKIWQYVKDTYGEFGEDGRLNVVLHSNSNSQTLNQTHTYLDIQLLLSTVSFPPNVIECSSDSSWKDENEFGGLICLTHGISDLVQLFAKATVDTDFLISTTKFRNLIGIMSPILTYDMLFKCGLQSTAQSYLNKSLAVASEIPKNQTFWMRDWFYPIYSQYGGSDVLNRYFDNYATYFPRKLNSDSQVHYWQYERTKNIGEFAHFWSGAAQTNLRNLLSKIYNWTPQHEALLKEAQMTYPDFKYLCQFCSKIPDNELRGNQNDMVLPKMKVYYKQENDIPFNHNTFDIKEAQTFLYQPKDGNASNLSLYKYDGHNPLYIVETEQDACYTVTCTSSYLVKWLTNIPLKDVSQRNKNDCGNWKYMNSRRKEDSPAFKHGNTSRKTYLPQDSDTTNPNSKYTISFIFRAYESNMGVLTCQSIENLTLATHFYFTDYPFKVPERYNSFDPDISTEALTALYLPIELFWENSTGSAFVVPCRGSRLSAKPDLIWSNYYMAYNGNVHMYGRQLWDSVKGSLVSELEFNGDPMLALKYDPVVGFTLDSAFQYFLFGSVTGYNYIEIRFYCVVNDERRFQFNVYPKRNSKHHARIQVLDQESNLSPLLNGCFFIQASDSFVSQITDKFIRNQHYGIKLIQCSYPHECDLLRQCLDFQHGICYSESCEIQSANTKIVNPHSHGLLRCIDYSYENGSHAIYEYTFIGLDRRRYLLSNKVPTKAIIFLEETPSVLYTNVKASFSCQIAHFMLVATIKFGLIFTNRTLLDIYDGSPDINNIDLQAEQYNTRDVSSVMSTRGNLGVGWKHITLNLTADVAGIICFAPFHNSTAWANVTRLFVTKDVLQPQIKGTRRSQLRSFNVGDADFNLYCEADGAPPPKIQWISPFDNEKGINTTSAKENHPNLTEVPDEKGNSVLKFPPMKKSFAGTYSCYASNEYGNDSYDYIVQHEERSLGIGAKVGIGFTVNILIGLGVGFLIIYVRYRQTKARLRDLTQEEVSEFTNGRRNRGLSHIQGEGQININMLPFDKTFILNPNDLMIENGVILGKGNFGIVHRGLLKGIPVAVKTLKSTADVTLVKSLLTELKIMGYIGDHANVIHFYGAVIEKIQKRVVEAVVELSTIGNLQDFLKKLEVSVTSTLGVNFCNLLVHDAFSMSQTPTSPNSINTFDLIDWCRQIASGMDFISSKRVYHGDLATRNILVFPNKTLKITDFGFAKHLYSSINYVKKQKTALPWRWMAVESLSFMEFSIQSDIWAFGVTMWEIFSLGKTPYPGLTWSPEFIKIISTGMRMAKPDYCPKSVYDEMFQCWDKNPEKRPPFSKLAQFCQDILQRFCPIVEASQDQRQQEASFGLNTSTLTSFGTCYGQEEVGEQSSNVADSVL